MRPHIIISAVTFDRGESGIAEYIRETIAELQQHARLTVYLTAHDAPHFAAGNATCVRIVPALLSHPLLLTLWHLFWLPCLIWLQRPNAVIMAAANRKLMAFYPAFTVGIVHDLALLRIKGKYGFWREFYQRHIICRLLRRVPALVAVSASTQRDIAEFCRIPPQRVQVLWNGIDHRRYRPRPAHTAHQLRKKYGLQAPFILYVARIEHPAKNHLRLLQACEHLWSTGRLACDLVLAGKPWAGAEPVLTAIEQSVYRHRIHLLGFVPAQDLPGLFNLAHSNVLVSQYEGFGIPAAQAMASGIPVLCSSTSSLPEICGDACVAVDPESVTAIARGLLQISNDIRLRQQLVEAGIRRASCMTWRAHAQGLIALCNAQQRPLMTATTNKGDA